MIISFARIASLLLACAGCVLVPATRAAAQYYLVVVQNAVQGDDDQENADKGEKEKLNPQVQALLKHYRPLYEGRLHGQLFALREVCNPTREQQEQLLRRAQDAFEEGLFEFAKKNRGQNQPMGVFIGAANGPNRQSTPWDKVQESLDKIYVDVLTKEQFELYLGDHRRRVRFRREATARSLVSAIDQQLQLEEEQRQAIEQELLDNWQDGWEDSIRGLMMGARYMPSIPDKLLKPHLNDRQKKVWGRVRQNRRIVFGDNGFMGHGKIKTPKFEALDQRPEEPPAEEEPVNDKEAVS